MTERGKLVVCFLVCMMGQAVTALPSWTDFFSALTPFRTPEEEELYGLEEETARLGFVQLNTGTTTFNTTLNLTGHILLGLGIATSLLLYMYLGAFDGGSSGYHDDGYGKRKRLPMSAVVNQTINFTGVVLFSLGISAAWALFLYLNGASNFGLLNFARGFKPDLHRDKEVWQQIDKMTTILEGNDTDHKDSSGRPGHVMKGPPGTGPEPEQEDLLTNRDLEDVGNLSNFVPELLAKMEEKLEAGGLDEPDCWLVASCEANRPGVKFSFATLGDAVQELYRLANDLRPPGTNDVTLLRHLEAMRTGRSGKDCKTAYPKCSSSYHQVVDVLAKS